MPVTKTPIDITIGPLAIDFLAMVSNVFEGGGDFVDHYLSRISDGNIETLLEKTTEYEEGWPEMRLFRRGPIALLLLVSPPVVDGDPAHVLIVAGAMVQTLVLTEDEDLMEDEDDD